MRAVTLMALMASVALLSGCSTTRVVTAPAVVYPHDLFVCPDPPKDQVTTQEDVAKFIVDLGGSYWICKQKLKTLEDLVNKPSQPMELKK